MSNRGDEFMSFVPLVVDHIDNYAVKQYGDAPNDNVEKWTSAQCMDAIGRYVKRFGQQNARGEEDNLLSCKKIAHYACLAHNKRQREIVQQLILHRVDFTCRNCSCDKLPSMLMLYGKVRLYCIECHNYIKDAEVAEFNMIADFYKNKMRELTKE